MASPRFSFGDFTEEEHNSYLNQPTCVEFPFSWDKQLVFEYDDEGVKVSDWGDCEPLPSLKDENHNHVPVNKDFSKDINFNIPPDATSALERSKVKNVNIEQRVAPKNSSQPSEIELQKKPLSNKESLTLKDEQKYTQVNSHPREDSLVNGHPENDSSETNDLESGVESLKTNEQAHNSKSSQLTNKTENGLNGIKTENNALNATSNSKEGVKLNGPTSEPDDITPMGENSQTPSSKPAEKSGSWASLFSGKTQVPKQGQPIPFVEGVKSGAAPTPITYNKPKDLPAPKKKTVTFNGMPQKPEVTTTVVDIQEDHFSKQIAEQITRNEIVYRSPGLMPRGFVNSSNWCYINATLQALLTCSPFCHLMRSFPSRQVAQDNQIVTSTPILDSFVRLVKELKPLPKRNIQRNSKEQWYGMPYEPDYIYKMLSVIKSNLSERGRQEDAEEFLSCVLNGLHEEMLKVTDHYNGKLQPSQPQQDDVAINSSQTEIGYEVPVHEEDPASDSNQDQEDQWEEVLATRKNRSSVTRRADISKTPVSEVFRGELRSDLYQEGQRGTATLEPFFTLPLDINDQSVWSVNEALENLTRFESMQDFTDSKTKAKVEAKRRLALETLPPVLVLHLKRFLYDKTGGSLKLDKEIQYHTDLILGKDLLSKPARKISQEKRSYKLFAVVYHHGKKSTGGHYTTDVYHDGLNCWLRIDDQHIKTTNVHEVVRHNAQRTAYLLYYKRTDLMSV